MIELEIFEIKHFNGAGLYTADNQEDVFVINGRPFLYEDFDNDGLFEYITFRSRFFDNDGNQYFGTDYPEATYTKVSFYSYEMNSKIGTGPNLSSATPQQGVPGFNERYYLNENSVAQEALKAGVYDTGLAHYLAEGKDAGLKTFAPFTKVHGYSGDDTIVLREGDETAFGYAGKDSIEGGAGNDNITAGADNDTVKGGDGNDTIASDAGVDSLYGEGGNDSLTDAAGASSLNGGAGDDTLTGGAAIDTLTGGTGSDTFDISAVAAVANHDNITDFADVGTTTSDIVKIAAANTTAGTAAGSNPTVLTVVPPTNTADGANYTIITSSTGTVDIVEFKSSDVVQTPFVRCV